MACKDSKGDLNIPLDIIYRIAEHLLPTDASRRSYRPTRDLVNLSLTGRAVRLYLEPLFWRSVRITTLLDKWSSYNQAKKRIVRDRLSRWEGRAERYGVHARSLQICHDGGLEGDTPDPVVAREGITEGFEHDRMVSTLGRILNCFPNLEEVEINGEYDLLGQVDISSIADVLSRWNPTSRFRTLRLCHIWGKPPPTSDAVTPGTSASTSARVDNPVSDAPKFKRPISLVITHAYIPASVESWSLFQNVSELIINKDEVDDPDAGLTTTTKVYVQGGEFFPLKCWTSLGRISLRFHLLTMKFLNSMETHATSLSLQHLNLGSPLSYADVDRLLDILTRSPTPLLSFFVNLRMYSLPAELLDRIVTSLPAARGLGLECYASNAKGWQGEYTTFVSLLSKVPDLRRLRINSLEGMSWPEEPIPSRIRIDRSPTRTQRAIGPIHQRRVFLQALEAVCPKIGMVEFGEVKGYEVWKRERDPARGFRMVWRWSAGQTG